MSGAPVRGMTRRKVVGAGLALAVLLAVGVGVLVRVTAHRPDDVVREYLSALQRRDADRALKIAGVARPAGEAGAFLSAAALDGGWRFELAEPEPSYSSTDVETVAVDVELVDTSGRPNPATVERTGKFQLTKGPDGWRIDEPFVTAQTQASPLGYLEINEARRAMSGAATSYLLFPGVHSPYPGRSEWLTVVPKRLFALPNRQVPLTYTPDVAVTERGAAAFQRVANASLDECLVDNTGSAQGCVLRTARDYFRTPSGIVMRRDIQAATWRVVRYPELNLPGGWSRFDDGSVALAGQVAVPGELRLSATGRDLDRRPTSFSQTCLVRDSWLGLAVGADGTMSTAHLRRSISERRPSSGRWVDIECY